MKVSNREDRFPIPVDESVIAESKICPCCKTGTIEVKEGRSMGSCDDCGQRYHIRMTKEKDNELAQA